jgi:hypothetical protein
MTEDAYDEERRWVDGGVRTYLVERLAGPALCECGARLPPIDLYEQRTMKEGPIGRFTVGGNVRMIEGRKERACPECVDEEARGAAKP